MSSLGALASLAGSADKYSDGVRSLELGTASYDKDGDLGTKGGAMDLFIGLASGELIQDASTSTGKLGSFSHMFLVQFLARSNPVVAAGLGAKEALEGCVEIFRGQTNSGIMKFVSAGMMLIPGGAVAMHAGKMFKLGKNAKELTKLKELKALQAVAKTASPENALKIEQTILGLVRNNSAVKAAFKKAGITNTYTTKASLDALALSNPALATPMLNAFAKYDKFNITALEKMIASMNKAKDFNLHKMSHVIGGRFREAKSAIQPYTSSALNGFKGNPNLASQLTKPSAFNDFFSTSKLDLMPIGVSRAIGRTAGNPATAAIVFG